MATALPNPIQRSGTAPSQAATAPANTSMSKDALPSESMPASSAGHQRFVLTDTVAARYLEHDPNTTVLVRRQKIQGYEIYLVEQWACSRSHPTFLITTYTGNPADSVLASIISVPADEAEWSPQMRLYFRSLTDYHARRKETPYGTLMITNLSGFPSSLTVIPIPSGDLKKYRDMFIVNENLKRLGCSGRLGIKLEAPSGATEAKFHQLYRTSEKIPLNGSVIELVKLCQVALVLFGKLEPEYADGLLCDVTEKAVNDWWVEFGAEYYTVEPHDGILGPTTVAALLGMLMGARNRLSACNAPVTKDVFDIESTKRGLAHFQKSQHIPRTRRLDRQTLDKLRRATAKAASKEGWAVPRAFKSTVAELGGKGGEMVMGMVGAGQKDGIAEIETVDIEQFVELVRGEHAKWLWHGKPRKSTVTDMFNRLPGDEQLSSADGQATEAKQLSRIDTSTDQQRMTKRDTVTESLFSPDVVEKEKDKDPFSKRATLKARLDPGSGLRHIKDVVGLRTHASKLSREEHVPHGLHRSKSDLRAPSHQDSNGGLISHSDTVDDATTQHPYSSEEPAFTKVLTETPRGSASTLGLPADGARPRSEVHSEPSVLRTSVVDSEASFHPHTVESSVAGSVYHGVDFNEKLSLSEAHEVPPLLRRTLSDPQLHLPVPSCNDDWWPRHLSFSIAEENVLKWTTISTTDLDEDALIDDSITSSTLATLRTKQILQTEHLKQLYYQTTLLTTLSTHHINPHLSHLHTLESAADTDIETLDSIYYPRLDTYHALREETHAVITNNRTQLTVSLRELSNIGDKLEYEIGALRSKAEDVEDALGEFERQVEGVESRAAELEKVLGRREGWWAWAFGRRR